MGGNFFQIYIFHSQYIYISITKYFSNSDSSNVNVTFWDGVAKTFHQELLKQAEDPVIIIITACKVATWNGDNLSILQKSLIVININN